MLAKTSNGNNGIHITNNGTNGHSTQPYPPCPSDYPEAKLLHDVKNVPLWRDQEPPHVHSLKWTDSDGIEHLHVVRGDTIDDVLVEVRTVKQFIRASREQDAKRDSAPVPQADTNETPETAEKPQAVYCDVHDVWAGMKTKNGQRWYSHKLEDGTWCNVPRPESK